MMQIKGLGDRMNIHIVCPEKGISACCNEYSVSEENIRKINEIEKGEAAPGEDILVLMPTRSYRTAYGDTLERIAMRFGITKRELLCSNPWLTLREPKTGENVTLRYGERRHGMKVANGYYHEGCSDDKLRMTLPYLTYVSFASAVADNHGVRRTMNDKPQVKMVSDHGKIPLVRIQDNMKNRFDTADNHDSLAEGMIDLATKGGYKGILLNSSSFSHSAKEYILFLLKMRKMMIGCDLILITEIDESTPLEFSEYADGSVMYYPKFAMDNPPSFKDGERDVLSNFACNGESAKTFIDLPCLAKAPKGYIGVSDAMEIARRNKYHIETNKSTLLSHFTDRKQGEYTFESLEGLKAIFDLIHEFDYMGICFDIMRVPINYLMMYNAMFKTCYQTNVRSREGCSRGGEE